MQINPIVFHSRSLCAEYISMRQKSLGLPRKLHYLLFKTLEMTRLAPYLKCLRYSVKYWLLLKICLLVPRHINILYEWTTPSYAFNASKHAWNNQIRVNPTNHILKTKKMHCVCRNVFLIIGYILKGFVILIIIIKIKKIKQARSNSHLINNTKRHANWIWILLQLSNAF